MSDEYTVCLAALLRSKGKNIVTENEFIMTISMDLHWMPYKCAKNLLDILLAKNLAVKNGGFIKPAFEVSDVPMPVVYKPSEAFIESLKNHVPASATVKTEPEPPKTQTPANPPQRQQDDGNVFPMMIQEAVEMGMEKRDFISETNSVSKKLNVDPLVAGLIILRDRGADIDTFADRIYDIITKK